MSPFKPTREDASSASDLGEMGQQATSPEKGVEARRVAGLEREERGGAEGNQRHPPHVTENYEDAPLQEEEERRPGQVEGQAATAHGREKLSLDEGAKQIDPESAYEHRSAEDKDTPPSARVSDRPSSPVD